MSALYSHTTRSTGTTLTAVIYNSDHQNHIDNGIPAQLDDYSTNATQMQSTTNPGEVGSESLATSLAGELERLRFMHAELAALIKGSVPAQWYSTVEAASASPTFSSLTLSAAASAIFGSTHKWYAFNDGTYAYFTNAASGGQEGIRVSTTELALLVGSSPAVTLTATTLSTPDTIRGGDALAIPAGGTDGQGLMYTSTANFGVFFGSGAPTLNAAKGSLYLRSDGSTTNDRAYINTNGTTGWTALTTGS